MGIFILTACTEAPAYREAFVLVEDKRQRCEDILSEVLAYWEIGISTPEQSITGYYSGEGLAKIAAVEARSAQARDVVARVSQRSGETRDLLLDFYASVEKLCNLARSPVGYSRLTFNDQRAAVRDEIGGGKAKLEILLPINAQERTAILNRFASAVQDAEKRVQAERHAAEKAAAAEQQRSQAAKQEAIKLVEAAEAEQQRIQYEAEEEFRRQDEAARQIQEAKRREYLRSSRPQAQAWVERHYGSVKRFCTVSADFVAALQANRYERFGECSALRDSVKIIRDRSSGGSAPPEIEVLMDDLLDSYEAGAEACLKRSALVSTLSFSRGDKACRKLRSHLTEYGFALEDPSAGLSDQGR